MGNAPTPGRPAPFSRRVQPACICLPSANGCQTWTRTRTSGLTGRRATLTPSGKMALPAGVAPASIRLEDECLVCFGHGSGLVRRQLFVMSQTSAPSATNSQPRTTNINWSARQELHLRSPGSRPGILLLHHALGAAVTHGRPGTCFAGTVPGLLGHRDPSWDLADPKGFAPSAFPQTTGCSAD